MAYSSSIQAGVLARFLRSIVGDAPALEGLSEDTLARVRARQVYAISRLTIPMMLANVVNATALLIVMELSGQNTLAVKTWTCAAICFALYTVHDKTLKLTAQTAINQIESALNSK